MIGYFESGIFNWDTDGDVKTDLDVVQIGDNADTEYYEYGNKKVIGKFEFFRVLMSVVTAIDCKRKVDFSTVRLFVDGLLNNAISDINVNGNVSLSIGITIDIGNYRSVKVEYGMNMIECDDTMLKWCASKLLCLVKAEEVVIRKGRSNIYLCGDIQEFDISHEYSHRVVRPSVKYGVTNNKPEKRYGAGRSSVCLIESVDRRIAKISKIAKSSMIRQTNKLEIGECE